MKKLNTVLSLFDGMSCGQLALNKAKIKYKHYIASEIDKHCIRVTKKNYPETLHFGNIQDIHFYNGCFEIKNGDSWIEDNTKYQIDLILAGSPCQGFSKAGKGLNFDDPRSKLFFEFIRILNQVRKHNPNVLFLLENVDILQEWQDVISKAVGIQPIKINSSLVSAQNRVRLYWTNIGTTKDMFGHLVPSIPQPKAIHIYLKDILENEVHEKYYLSDSSLSKIISRYNVNQRGLRPFKNDGHSSGMSEFGNISFTDQKTDSLTSAHQPKFIAALQNAWKWMEC